MRFRLRWQPNTWYLVGFVLIFLSVLWWLLMGLVMATQPEYMRYIIEFGFLVSAVPLGFGIYCLLHSRRMSRKARSRRSRAAGPPRASVREELCNALREIGLEAGLAKRGRAEEKTGEGSLGLIEIAGEPINWTNVNSRTAAEGETSYYLDFGLNDGRLRPETLDIVLRSVYKKRFFFFGSVVDLFWKGRDTPDEIIELLNDDVSIKEQLIKDGNVTIRAHGRYQCWTITQHASDIVVPSPALWDCYRAIARHLLASALIFDQ